MPEPSHRGIQLSGLESPPLRAQIAHAPAPSLATAIQMEVRVKAEARSLVHAFTEPEYVDAWLSFPDHGEDCTNVMSRIRHSYQIDHTCAGRPTLYAFGTYLVQQRHRVVFSWSIDGMVRVSGSIVDVRLFGDFGYTAVILRHAGLCGEQDAAWHRTLWGNSLARLCRLYGGLSRVREVSGERLRRK